jgi:hypothetical protein
MTKHTRSYNVKTINNTTLFRSQAVDKLRYFNNTNPCKLNSLSYMIILQKDIYLYDDKV